ncbi:MAG: hypothetical protein JWR83_2053, partial [Aeromicrobium sp.]|nr:hypothetical protein [Aeromicrobium sp.]
MTSTAMPPSPAGARRRPRRIWRRLVVSIGVFALVLGIGGAAAYWKLNGNIHSSALKDHVVKDDTPKGATNILFIGSDSR